MPEFYWGTGRRKSSVARVRIHSGTGQVIINERPVDKYFSREDDKVLAAEPLKATNRADKYDVHVTVSGGGATGQAGAVRHGISRALALAEKDLLPILKANKFLTRDPRMKERKKYGLRGARRGQQYSKR